jgi:hypothetical protein
MWRAVVSQPLDRTKTLPQLGSLDEEMGEFWEGNAFAMPVNGDNLSAFERNRLFLNDGSGGPFLDASFASGADIDSDSRSVVAADFNRDGKPDLLVASVGGGSLRLFLNQLETTASSLQVRFAAGTEEMSQVGVRVTIHCAGRQIIRDCFPVNGCLGQAPDELLIGLGDVEQIDSITVRWPDGSLDELGACPVGGQLIVQKGGATRFHSGWLKPEASQANSR